VGQERLPDWEADLIDEAIRTAEQRLEDEKVLAQKRAVQLGREQGYHRLALEIDRPARSSVSPAQLSFFPQDPTLFDDAS
jgi:hypothetical protein